MRRKSQRHRWSVALIALGSLGFPAASLVADGLFVDRAAALGLSFRHQDGRSGAKYYVETAASGGGFFDFDDDGDLDVVLLNGAKTPGSPLPAHPGHRLFERVGDRFVDITNQAGLVQGEFGMGLCVGDVDGDGRLDLMVTNYGPDRLYRNLGAGKFAEIGAAAGVQGGAWSTGCAFGDIDGDRDLDLYVAHYVDFRYDRNPFCGDRARNLRAYCRPEAFEGVPDALFINRGDGTFTEEGARRGLAQGKDEKGFGVVMTDLDNDGDLDIYVANDGTMNRLYVNDGQGNFRDQALLAGVGLGARGQAESGMGVAAGDLDHNGWVDLLVTNYSLEPNTLYLNQGDLFFEDGTRRWDLFEVAYKFVGWGVAYFDYDNDRDLDLAVANGHAVDNIEIFEAGLQYRQQNFLLENRGGKFHRVRDPGFEIARVSRALAVGDVDTDGRLDLLITNTNDPTELLINQAPIAGRHWLGIKLLGKNPNRHAIGARARLEVGNEVLLREVQSGGSFLSQHDLRLHFGLGEVSLPITLQIRWPDGRKQREVITAVDRYLEITEK